MEEVKPTSERVEGRFIHDFLYVGQAIPDDLTAAQRQSMVAFFERELRTPTFVRAMSQLDPSAATTGSRRADHNQCEWCNCKYALQFLF